MGDDGNEQLDGVGAVQDSGNGDNIVDQSVEPNVQNSKLFNSLPDSSTDDELRNLVGLLAAESIKMHREVAMGLRNLTLCEHGRKQYSDWPCDLCCKLGDVELDHVCMKNAFLGRYIRELLRTGCRNPPFARKMATKVGTTIRARIAEVELYLHNLSEKISPSSMKYWKRFGTPLAEAVIICNQKT